MGEQLAAAANGWRDCGDGVLCQCVGSGKDRPKSPETYRSRRQKGPDSPDYSGEDSEPEPVKTPEPQASERKILKR